MYHDDDDDDNDEVDNDDDDDLDIGLLEKQKDTQELAFRYVHVCF